MNNAGEAIRGLGKDPNRRLTFAWRLNDAIGTMDDWKEAAGEGADGDPRGACGPRAMKFAGFGEGLEAHLAVDSWLDQMHSVD
jgi:hypothetical protein